MILSAVDAIEETPIDRYLAQQRDLSAVDRFSQRHESELLHRQERYYRDLLPAAPPAPGQQYGFEVDLDTCSGCKACVTACHSLNGLDEGESWRAVDVIHGGTVASPWQQTVTAACHHCVDPACLNGCPVDAYDKDPITGIVAHLDDQCIGCGYCTLTCPYEVPAFNHDRGIVRKCDMCRGRLEVGEAPACVQACPSEAIRIAVVDVDELKATAATTRVPGGPSSSLTIPSTRYTTAKGNARVAESPRISSPGQGRSHLPLVVMLVLTQLSVGVFVTDLALRLVTENANARSVAFFDSVLVLTMGALALGASVLHLGRPRYAYRAVIGLRHSWLSREVVAFGTFTALTAAYAVLVWFGPSPRTSALVAVLGGLVAATGILGVVCSVAVYVVTRRGAWRAAICGPKFVLTAAVCGLATVQWASLLSAAVAGRSAAGHALVAIGRPIPLLLAPLVVVELVWEVLMVRRVLGLSGPHAVPGRQFDPDLRTKAMARVTAATVGGIALPLLLAATITGRFPSWLTLGLGSVALVAVVAGELLERVLFFDLSTPPP